MSVIGVTRGVFLAMNPQTGEILAMVSLPAYDNNAFAQGISTASYKRFLKDPDRPLLNMAIGEQYPPGSDLQARDRSRRTRGRQDHRRTR